jgi:hypothetical protein
MSQMAYSALTAHHIILDSVSLPPFPLTAGYISAFIFPISFERSGKKSGLWNNPLIFELLGISGNNAKEPPPPLALRIIPLLDSGMTG